MHSFEYIEDENEHEDDGYWSFEGYKSDTLKKGEYEVEYPDEPEEMEWEFEYLDNDKEDCTWMFEWQELEPTI